MRRVSATSLDDAPPEPGRQDVDQGDHHVDRASDQPEIASTAATSIHRIPRSVRTSRKLNIRIDSSICWPSPPAPSEAEGGRVRLLHPRMVFALHACVELVDEGIGMIQGGTYRTQAA